MEKQKKPMYDRHEAMDITWEQEKVISNPFRSRLVALLYDQAMTPKQTAVMMNKNPGTVYYHIQQLLKHGILEIERTETNKGVVEKYYRAKAMSFRNIERDTPSDRVASANTFMYLSDELLEQLKEELGNLYIKYGHLSYKEKDTKETKTYTMEYHINKFNEEEDDS